MRKSLLVVGLVAATITCLVLFAGCHGKKTRPMITPEETRPPAGQMPREEAIKPSENPIQPIGTLEGEEGPLRDIHFDYDKYNLTDEAADVMAANGEYLMNHPDLKVLIEGHCDERGTEEYNLALGEKRALAARDFLVRFGIDKSRVSIISYGEERPLDPASNEMAWSINRRAHFVID
jgi:peptidoglycan-associated lipoprotein